MKKLLVVLTLASSLSSFSANALEAIPALVIAASTIVPSMITTRDLEASTNQKVALQIIEDAQVHYQTGEMSIFLKQKIRDVLVVNEALSEAEALDALVSVSLDHLK